MAHTIDDFLNYYPEFDAIQNKAVINEYLEEADLMVDMSKCPSFERLIRFAYAAHALSKSAASPTGQDDSIGIATSSSVGNVSENRDVGNKKTRSYADNYYSSTVYGVRFLQLRAKCFGGGMVAP